MAPEYLLQKVAYNPACDIYSFGMILYEIYSRKSPYEGENPRKILRKVCDPRVNHRPAIPATCPGKMREIMKKCWNGKSAIRPAAEDLDMLFTDMSANDVEPLIDEGNTRIRTEVASGDMLYKVFPRKVADQIKVGKKVEP
jgi:serine/threonine protein kinase